MSRLDLVEVRRGTAAAWAAKNPVLADGEPGYETDTKTLKFGDGTTPWLSLQPSGNATLGPGSASWLQAIAGQFGFAFATITTSDTSTGLPTAGTVLWPDGTGGNFTGTIDGAGNGYSGYVVTWTGSTTKTVTASGITYNANGVPIGPTSLVVS